MKLKAARISPFLGLYVDKPFLTAMELGSRFFKALESMSDADALYLARGIGVGHRTIQRWKYEYILPADYELIFQLIIWVENGKPIEKIDDEEFIPWLN